jgi:hypothetical protein
MPQLIWDVAAERLYESGVDHGVLYPKDIATGTYPLGVVWNGLTGVTESPGGAELTDLWADNLKYASIRAAETFGATVEAYTYPDEFAECDGSVELIPGVKAGQQTRKPFGLSYRTKIGSADDEDLGYKLHLIYGASANPSEKAYTTINESPDGITFSWELVTDPVPVTGQKPTASLEIDSTKVNAAKLLALEDILYGTAVLTARLPLPDEIVSLMTGDAVVPTPPTFVAATGILTIPTTANVIYKVNGVETAAGAQDPIDGGQYVTVVAEASVGYYFEVGVPYSWMFISTLE